MLKRLRSLFSKRPSYREVATEDDFEFIVARCIAEARDGHFSEVYAKPIPAVVEGLRHQIACAISDRPYPMEPSNPRSGTGAKICIVGYGNERVGFFLLLEDQPGTWDRKIELHLLSILPEWRGRGIVAQIVQDILKMTPARQIYARCYANSTGMIRILKHAGFQTTDVSFRGTQTLTLER